MIVLSFGVTKSGSTLAFELCKAILEMRGFKQRRLPDTAVFAGHSVNFMESPSPAQLEAMQQVLAPGEAIAIKLHRLLSPESRRYLDADQQGRFRVHINYRDPREVCLSLMDAGAAIRRREPQRSEGFCTIHTLADAARYTRQQLQDLRSWAAIHRALYLYYNDVAFSTDHVMDRMCVDLGLEVLDTAERSSIKDELFNHTHTLKNKAAMDRYKTDLNVEQNRFLLNAIPGLATFVERACAQRDYRWLASGMVDP